MSLASSNIGKAIIVLIVVVVSIMIFTSKVRMASLPFLNWGEDDSSSGISPVSSTVQLAVNKLKSIHSALFDLKDDVNKINFDIRNDPRSKVKFYVYYGIYNGEYYYMMFKDVDPGLDVGSSYTLTLKKDNVNVEVEKRVWWKFWISKTTKEFEVDYIDKIEDFLIYDIKLYDEVSPESLKKLCSDGRFCVTASLKGTGEKYYYFSHYTYNKESKCADYYSNVIFVASKKKHFGDISKPCIDAATYAYSLLDDLFKNISAKEIFDLSAIKYLDDKFLIMVGVSKDSRGSFKNSIVLCDFSDTRFNPAKEYLEMISHDWQTYAEYDKGVFDKDYLDFSEGTLKCKVLRLKEFTGFLNGPLPFNYKEGRYTEDDWNDYVDSLNSYLNSVSRNTFIPVFYLSKDSFVLVYGPYSELMFHPTFVDSGYIYKISLKCNVDGNYCYIQPVS